MNRLRWSDTLESCHIVYPTPTCWVRSMRWFLDCMCRLQEGHPIRCPVLGSDYESCVQLLFSQKWERPVLTNYVRSILITIRINNTLRAAWVVSTRNLATLFLRVGSWKRVSRNSVFRANFFSRLTRTPQYCVTMMTQLQALRFRLHFNFFVISLLVFMGDERWAAVM